MDLPENALPFVAAWLPRQRWFAGKGREITGTDFATVVPLGPGMWNTAVNVSFGSQAQLYQVPLILRGADLHDGAADPRLMSALLTGAHWVHPAPRPLTYRPLTLEQSHSAGVCSERVFVKLYRLLTPGVNPDVEVPVALQGSRWVPPVWGWAELAGGTSSALLQEFLPDAEVGWELAKQGEVDAQSLGEAIAGLHADLGRAFPTGSVTGAQVRARLSERVLATARDMPSVADVLPGIMRRLEPLSRLARIPVQRIHGDLHLGQVLRSGDDWKVIDFEGEPGRPAAERRAPGSVWQDVAAMLRSFDYAGLEVADEFLAGYGRPADQQLLTALLIDKVVYEVAYESRNRPDWVEIPLRALRALTA